MTAQDPTINIPEKADTKGPPFINFDAAEFMHFLADTDWSDEQKSEYLALVWNIVCEFVAMGFDVHPLQQAQKTCGEPSDTDAEHPVAGSAMVNSSHHSRLIEKFVRQSGAKPCSGREGVIDE